MTIILYRVISSTLHYVIDLAETIFKKKLYFFMLLLSSFFRVNISIFKAG